MKTINLLIYEAQQTPRDMKKITPNYIIKLLTISDKKPSEKADVIYGKAKVRISADSYQKQCKLEDGGTSLKYPKEKI